MITVKITPDEALAAGTVGVLRQLRAVSRDKDHHGYSRRLQRDRWADQIHGSLAEVAASKALRLPWTPGGAEISSGDIASKFEVRATECKSGHLIVYKHESDDSPFILVIGHYPLFNVIGWIMGKDAKVDRFWNKKSDPPCYWVPQGELMSIETLEGVHHEYLTN